MRRKTRLGIGACLPVLAIAGLVACAPGSALLPVQNSLPSAELAYYSDAFDAPREELWDRAGFVFRAGQLQNLKQARMRYDGGRLVIRTQTGGFSKGGLSSRYWLRGDFDIQLDCRFEFAKGVAGMDQLFVLGVVAPGRSAAELKTVSIGLSMEGGSNAGQLFSNCIMNGRDHATRKATHFDGTLRILRKGRHISTLYRNAGAAEWSLHRTFSATEQDVLVGFTLANFLTHRSSIQAAQQISVEVGEFRVAAAQGIIEEEI